MTFIAAWGLIYQQVLLVPPGQADGRVLALAGTLLGVPGLSVVLPRLLAVLSSDDTPDSTGTTGPGSVPAQQESS